jgi:hypothetical protein
LGITFLSKIYGNVLECGVPGAYLRAEHALPGVALGQSIALGYARIRHNIPAVVAGQDLFSSRAGILTVIELR